MTRRTRHFFISSIVPLLLLAPGTAVISQEGPASSKQPLSFGVDQTIIDLNRLEWSPLEAEGAAPGAQIAVLLGDLEGAGPVEAVVRLPARYTFPNHSHTSDEVYVWIKGDFTYVAADGTTADLSGQSFISLPGGVPHALACGDEPCLFYLRYSRSFDLHVHPMPVLKEQGG